MTITKFLIICLVCIVATVVAFPTPKITILRHDIQVDPKNPYFGDWKSEILPPGDTLNIKMPIKKDLPQDLRVKIEIKIDNKNLFNTDTTLCKLMELGQALQMNVLLHKYGEPKDKFPIKCPIKACEECEIIHYKYPTNKIPSIFPEGTFSSHMIVYETDVNSPYMTVDSVTQLTYEK